ncbi:bifunctional 2-C-methyl-D-erythritol 4-phosphate cytidylyltransferase/2-C-methyl-D-erythritol 2,4-cyclodiphosphate synthase [Yoonia sp. 208BN28-4]|uniref:bifunctional 2-C-methyl-D-erythritol 4-phosphate cytidylyltransferase/2-C-methyl-D-erythritol 2,4-cyclodiphosphate synthase n=1 Tax=Yoonia sp. 208BN28-4 TaxID=3126505 RepID=UPI0030B1B2B0
MSIATIIVAAGKGERAGGDVPKQWQMIAGQRVIDHTIAAFTDLGPVVIVVSAQDHDRAVGFSASGHIVVQGGATRDASVRAGLAALADIAPDHVLIHDAARPLVSTATIAAVCEALKTSVAAAPALAVTDALWTGADGQVTGTKERDGLYRAQTPQGFHYKAIVDAHAAHDGPVADDVAVARAAGIAVAIVDGDDDNLKITTPADFARAERHMQGRNMDIRLGNGYDVHRFGPGDHVWLCGVKVPHDRSLQGHSDADVGMHAVTDAIYGALGRGDIGQHFPPSDPQWKGAASHIFLEHACALARELGFSISNADCTLICEHPKIGPHAADMKAKMADIMQMETDRISVKATTSEKLGFTGRGEGIAAIATATLVKT